jgi:Predicted membrane protein (DUF2306)
MCASGGWDQRNVGYGHFLSLYYDVNTVPATLPKRDHIQMTTAIPAPHLVSDAPSAINQARRQLTLAARGWFVATVIGQLLFVTFILLFYYTTTLSGNYAGWNAKPLIAGYVSGDVAGNQRFALHVLLAAVMTLAGLIQLVPQVRSRWPALHRWSGRLFLSLVLVLSVSGLWLTWVRGSYLTITGAVAISLDAALIIGFALMAWRTAWKREFAAHRRWALRTFIVASGVWFMRVGYMLWGLVTGGAGIGPKMAGPFDLFWAFATYLLPLVVLELYLRAERSSPPIQRIMAGGLWLAAALILVGSGAAWMVMWSPYI